MTPTPEAFNAASVAKALVGTWRYETEAEPTGIGYLHFSDDGRFIQFVLDPQQPGKRWPMRLLYSIDSLSKMRLRPKANKDGWLCGYGFDGVTLNISSTVRSIPCRRANPEEVPGWFKESLAAALSRP